MIQGSSSPSPPVEWASASPANEILLIRRAAAGDGAAFAQLIEPCRDRMWAVCYRITGRHHDAEDALQDALTAAWRHLGSFRGTARFSTWLYRIATNAALGIVQRRRDIALDGIPETPAAGSFADQVDAGDALQRALAQLPPTFRATVVMREYADMTYADIAAAQGVNIQTVKSRLNRGRRALRELLVEG